MSRPLRLHIPNVLYHVTSRGNAKQHLFLDDDDHLKYLSTLAYGLERFQVRCSAYCLMGNHVHLLLTPGPETISRLMQQVGSGYAQWFNKRHSRCGHVVQGRPDIRLVDSNAYYLRAHRYVLRNPVKAGFVSSPAEWRWSSYRATAGLADVPEFVDLHKLWRAFDGDAARAQQLFRKFAECADDDHNRMFAELLCGSQDFALSIEPELQPFRTVREFSYDDRFASRPPVKELVGGIPRGPDLEYAVRRAFEVYAYTLAEIADVVGCHPTLVWQWVHRAGPRPLPLFE